MTRNALSLVLVFLAVGCGRGGDGPDGNPPEAGVDSSGARSEASAEVDLAGTSWRLEDLAGKGVVDRTQTTLTFGPDDQVSGSGGCNRFTGRYERHGDSLSFGPLAATRMACPDAVMNQETGFFAVLDSAVSHEITSEGYLLLHPAGGGPATRLAPMEHESP